MAIVWDYSARNRRQKLRKFTPANVTPPKSRDHAVPGLIDVADCRNVPPWNLPEPRTFSWPIEQNTGGPTRQKKFGTWWRSRRHRQPSRRRSTPTLSRLFHDYVILEGRSAYAYAERVPPEYGVAPDYRYAIANQRTETTRRIVRVID
jgi:hypothetical protein